MTFKPDQPRHVYKAPATTLGIVEPPSVLHPAMAGEKAFPEGQAPAGISNAAGWLKQARETWERVNHVRTTADPSMTESGHILAVNETAEKAMNGVLRNFDSARAALTASAARLQSEIEDAARLTPTAHAGEIRSVIRSLPESDRYNAILTAMNGGDTATIAAVMSAPGITSGLSDDQVKNLRNMYTKRAAPTQHEHLAAVQKADQNMLTALDQMLVKGEDLSLSSKAKLLKEKQAAARAAAQALKPSGGMWG